jgi:hypothetical protein
MEVMAMNAPVGYMTNAQGHLVPIEKVKPIDRLRDELVMSTVNAAAALQSDLRVFKKRVAEDIAALVSVSAEEYDCKIGGYKGNVTLTSYDGRHKLVRANSDSITFDERLQAAKELIDECIHRWTDGTSPEVRALIQGAFQTDKTGKINTGRVLSLSKLDIHDEQWLQAMAAIRDSVTIASSKMYFRIYERVGNTDQWQPLTLDIAAL